MNVNLPPLPQGWTQHAGPNGQPYYFNTLTNVSTYVRPPPVLVPPPAPGPVPKKEKPVAKTPIAGTDWLRVRTTEGNVFYTHKGKKQSVWTVPPEIEDAVRELEEKEREEEAKAKAAMVVDKDEADFERIKREVEGIVAKRKAEEAGPATNAKKSRIEEVHSDESDQDDEEEEEWQREAASQLAEEAEEEARKRKQAEEEERRQQEELKRREKEKGAPAISMPNKVDLSLDEAKALFKTLLREKDINPLLPWDKSLPLFVNDPRYVLLPSVSARREAFDEYCRDRSRELREQKVKAEKGDGATRPAGAKEEFEKLLRDEVKSTRTSWTDWRRQWKKDRRFYGWGRDDREREKKFREYLKELGEQKRKAAEKAEADFFKLLKEKGTITKDSAWKEVKKQFQDDPRYDAVGSSSLREELFNTYLKTLSSNGDDATPTSKDASPAPKPDAAASTEDRQKRKERAVKEREERVKVDRQRMEEQAAKTRQGLTREESERDFQSLLTDAIRDPLATWEQSQGQLSSDPRFTRSQLPVNQLIHLFEGHVGRLRATQLLNLHALFLSYAPSLSVKFGELPVTSLMSSLPATKLKYNVDDLEDEFRRWQRTRETEARRAFDEMMGENSFVDFWGRMKRIGGEGVNGGVKADEGGEEDEGEGGGGKADMKALAKAIDLGEVERVLKNDKRYAMFDHRPEDRAKWIREYLENLSAPKLSVHLNNAV